MYYPYVPSGYTIEYSEEEKWIQKMYPVGHRFWYLGREMIVGKNTGRKVFCEYTDNNGVIQSWKTSSYTLLKTLA